ncbi:uncharacterized protein PV09_03043 [Verruconis gallopava]|uniref:AAA+ ATPase domain-containing protein n=1 Tax=Verruconis gallopava TaxID=253628 RepID=A0A0D2B3J2_9PEZI|nr:uncharacterized protein PV09_03043 [Verruconis gallopava]KIW05839.1 hypothetical protein PV09_03043 [Verruconis gallopava]
MTTASPRKWAWAQDFLSIAIASFAAYWVARSLINRLDPEGATKAEAQQKADAARKKLEGILTSRRSRRGSDASTEETSSSRPWGHDRPALQDLQLSSYEQTIAMEVVAPEDIPVSFEDIGGLDNIIEELKESVIYPLTMPHLYASSSSLLAAPSGVLLYGPPGCGKTMMAKALAHESGACFINLHISTITEKWYGDSNKLVNAVFSLARKLQPTIVFIDEIDAVLGQRRSGEHEASGMVKAEFMTHWDGLASSNSSGTPQRICILGATNRIQDIDEAILRRMPKKFPVSLPNAHQRRGIFKLILRDTKIDRQNFDLDQLVKLSAGMSGSDIKEACRDAAMGPVREYIQEMKRQGRLGARVDPKDVRGVRTSDFFGRAGSVNAQYATFEKSADVQKRERAASRSQTESVGVASDDDGYETISEESDKEDERPRSSSRREREFERDNGPD